MFSFQVYRWNEKFECKFFASYLVFVVVAAVNLVFSMYFELLFGFTFSISCLIQYQFRGFLFRRIYWNRSDSELNLCNIVPYSNFYFKLMSSFLSQTFEMSGHVQCCWQSQLRWIDMFFFSLDKLLFFEILKQRQGNSAVDVQNIDWVLMICTEFQWKTTITTAFNE